jgi:hypothetical protein
MYHTSPASPERVLKRDGRLVPFEADKISRALFAAGESLGQPDAFLARELTDGVVHFLAAEKEDETLTTARVAELVVKVVRELGQPALAEAFAEYGRRRERGSARPDASRAVEGEVVLRFPPDMPAAAVLAASVRSYTLQSVYARDLVAARADGLLSLTGLDHPCELEGHVTGPTTRDVADAVAAARRLVGRFVVFDGPEYAIARAGEMNPTPFERALGFALRVTGLPAVVNLNAAVPPPWAADLAGGPLFARQDTPAGAQIRSNIADMLVRGILRNSRGHARIDWHLGANDFLPEARARLESVVQAALDREPVAFVFDRPKRPIALAEGIDRAHPAVLLTVGLHLPRLAAQPGVGGDPARFLRKLASLARLALSAGVQKRAFLRKQERAHPQTDSDAPAVSAGFLLDRARLVVAPLGLDEVVEAFTGSTPVAGSASLDFAKQIVVQLRDVLRQDGRQSLLETCVDGPGPFTLPGELASPAPPVPLTPAAIPPIRDLLRAASPLHAATECGTLTVPIPADAKPSAAEAADWLQLAWQRSEVVRLRIVRV